MEIKVCSTWPIIIQDRQGNSIYLTRERWEHALDHPGMHVGLLSCVLETLRKGKRKQDPYDPAKYKYSQDFTNLPGDYTHIVVVVKFSWHSESPRSNNFVLTAYLIEKW